MNSFGFRRIDIRWIVGLATLLVAVSGWAQETPPLPIALPFSEDMYGKASPYRERFRAVGWSMGGALAYVTISPAGQPCQTCSLYRFVIQNLITDEVIAVVASEAIENSNTALETWWKSVGAEISRLLERHQIESTAQYDFVEGNHLKLQESDYTFRLAAAPGFDSSGGRDEDFEVLLGVQVIAVSEQLGWKRIFAAVPERSVDRFTIARVVGVLTSPFENRAGVILALGNVGKPATDITLVGSHLTAGFTGGDPVLPSGYTLVKQVATAGVIKDAVAQSNAIIERRALVEIFNKMMAVVKSRDKNAFAQFVSEEEGLYIVSTPGARHMYQHVENPEPAYADVGVYSASLRNIKSVSGQKGILSEYYDPSFAPEDGSELERIKRVEDSVRFVVTFSSSRLMFAWLLDSWRLIIIDKRDLHGA